MAARFSGPGLPYEGTITNGRWSGTVRVIDSKMSDPISWTRPRRIFVNSMSDLFHANLPDDTIDEVVAVMAACHVLAKGHVFQPLTKRAERLPIYWNRLTRERLTAAWARLVARAAIPKQHAALDLSAVPLPLPNVHMGVTIEHNATAHRALDLGRANVAVRWASVEPMIGPVDLPPGLDWAVIGAESGHGARPTDLAWVRKVVADCARSGSPCS